MCDSWLSGGGGDGGGSSGLGWLGWARLPSHTSKWLMQSQLGLQGWLDPVSLRTQEAGSGSCPCIGSQDSHGWPERCWSPFPVQVSVWVTLTKACHGGRPDGYRKAIARATGRGWRVMGSSFYNQPQVFSPSHPSCLFLTESSPFSIYNYWLEIHPLKRNHSNRHDEYSEILVSVVHKVLLYVRGWIQWHWSTCFWYSPSKQKGYTSFRVKSRAQHNVFSMRVIAKATAFPRRIFLEPFVLLMET